MIEMFRAFTVKVGRTLKAPYMMIYVDGKASMEC